MGQIERYGLYVLVLVIMLILGVAIWGDGSEVAAGPRNPNYLNARGGSGASASLDRPRGGEEPEADPMELVDLFNAPASNGTRFAGGDDVVFPPDPAGGGGARGEREPSSGSGGAPQDGPAVVDEPAPARTYTVVKGDSYYRIALRQLGSASRMKELQALNPSIAPKDLRPGQVLVLPAGASAVPAASSPTGSAAAQPPGTGFHVVQSGETIDSIAESRYGKARKGYFVERIQHLNPGVDPRRMRPGIRLRMPDADSAVASR